MIIEKITTLKKWLNKDNLIRKPYYYVPPCPCCGSRLTGRFVKEHRVTEHDWMLKETLKNGELIKALPVLPEYETAFCVNCEYTWRAQVELKLLTINEINEERMARMTDVIYYDLFTTEEEKERNAKLKKNFIVNHVTKFVGKI